MTTKFIIIAVCICIVITAITKCQNGKEAGISNQEAINLLKSLHKQASDTSRIGIYLKSAANNLRKEGDEKQDPDSAATFIRNAKKINDLKGQNIQLLTRKHTLQENQFTQGSLLWNINYSEVTLLIIIVGLLYNRYRLKQRVNSKLELQQEEIARQNISLLHLANEKDWLVKEIHHRVKNNLQTVTGLLGTQSAYLKTEEAINAINESQHRIQAMSLIYQRLYQSNDLSAIKITDYIHELVNSLSDSFDTGSRILFNLEIEPLQLDLAHAIPIGLILNEAITNSFKYAFPGGRQGLIYISLKNSIANNFLLTIKDNGTGIPPGFNADLSDSMGMNLMQGLSREIGAQFILSNKTGTRIDISFVYDPDVANEIP